MGAIRFDSVGTCEFSFTPKDGSQANTFRAKSLLAGLSLSFVVAKLPSKSSFSIPPGIRWEEEDSRGNEKKLHLGIGEGVVLGDEGTGYIIDASLPSYPETLFSVSHGKVCFSRGEYIPANFFADIDVGAGTGCLPAGWSVTINVDTQTVVSGPSDGSGGAGGAGGAGGQGGEGGLGGISGSAGAGGTAGSAGEGGSSGSGLAGTAGSGGFGDSDAGGSAGHQPLKPPSDDDDCGCKVVGNPSSSGKSALLLLAVGLIALRRRRRH